MLSMHIGNNCFCLLFEKAIFAGYIIICKPLLSFVLVVAESFGSKIDSLVEVGCDGTDIFDWVCAILVHMVSSFLV